MRFAHLYTVLGALLIASPKPVAAQDPQIRLWDASMLGDTARIRKAVGDGAKLDSLDTRRNPNGRLALNWAAQADAAPAVVLLLKLGANIEGENRTGFSALHHAAESGSMNAARALLAAGANPAHPNKAGKLPAQTARDKDHADIALLIESAKPIRKQ